MKSWFALAVLAVAVAFAQDAQEPRKIGPDVKPPIPLARQEPTYTEEAREARLQGAVVLSLTIDAEGNPKDVKVVRGLGLGLDEKAVEAVGAWRFEPARLRKDNTPVAVKANIEVNFRLN